MINLHLLNTGKDLKHDQISMIRMSFNKAVKTCQKLISTNDVDVIIYHNPAYVMKETGIGGKTLTTHVIEIPLDAKRKLDPETLYLTICHEMYHAVRQRKFGFPSTLLDAIISEGLADQFEVEINSKRQPITFMKDINTKALLNGLSNLKKGINKKDYDYSGWFFGSSTYPKWLGYTLGNLIVERYVKDSNTKPSGLVGKNTNIFLKSMESVIATLS